MKIIQKDSGNLKEFITEFCNCESAHLLTDKISLNDFNLFCTTFRVVPICEKYIIHKKEFINFTEIYDEIISSELENIFICIKKGEELLKEKHELLELTEKRYNVNITICLIDL